MTSEEDIPKPAKQEMEKYLFYVLKIALSGSKIPKSKNPYKAGGGAINKSYLQADNLLTIETYNPFMNNRASPQYESENLAIVCNGKSLAKDSRPNYHSNCEFLDEVSSVNEGSDRSGKTPAQIPGQNFENRFVKYSTNLDKYKAEIYEGDKPKYQNHKNGSKGNLIASESFYKGKPRRNSFKSFGASTQKKLIHSKVGLNGCDLIRGNLNLSPLKAKNNWISEPSIEKSGFKGSYTCGNCKKFKNLPGFHPTSTREEEINQSVQKKLTMKYWRMKNYKNVHNCNMRKMTDKKDNFIRKISKKGIIEQYNTTMSDKFNLTDFGLSQLRSAKNLIVTNPKITDSKKVKMNKNKVHLTKIDYDLFGNGAKDRNSRDDQRNFDQGFGPWNVSNRKNFFTSEIYNLQFEPGLGKILSKINKLKPNLGRNHWHAPATNPGLTKASFIFGTKKNFLRTEY